MAQESGTVGATATTFAVLRGLLDLGGAGVTELSAHLDLPKSTLHDHLRTLHEEEFVVTDGSTYRLGLRFLELGACARNQRQIYETARPEVDRLADETGELANLLVEERGWGVYLHRSRGDEAVRVEAFIGNRVHLHSTALGKAVLAHLPDERVAEIVATRGLPAQTERTTTDPDALRAELDAIRERGYAVDDEEHHAGLRCLAAPILDGDGRVLGAMSVAGPTNRMRGERFDERLPRLLKERVNVVELNVTYS
jgi:DNA-binding IclR family transcriptional regulator